MPVPGNRCGCSHRSAGASPAGAWERRAPRSGRSVIAPPGQARRGRGNAGRHVLDAQSALRRGGPDGGVWWRGPTFWTPSRPSAGASPTERPAADRAVGSGGTPVACALGARRTSQPGRSCVVTASTTTMPSPTGCGRSPRRVLGGSSWASPRRDGNVTPPPYTDHTPGQAPGPGPPPRGGETALPSAPGGVSWGPGGRPGRGEAGAPPACRPRHGGRKGSA